jgi:ferredoxin
MQPDLWRMSKKDGKANLLKAIIKRDCHILPVHEVYFDECSAVAQACPVNIIKLN